MHQYWFCYESYEHWAGCGDQRLNVKLYMAGHHEVYTALRLECTSNAHLRFVLTSYIILQSPVYSHTQQIRITL